MEADKITAEEFLEAMKALQHIASLADFSDDGPADDGSDLTQGEALCRDAHRLFRTLTESRVVCALDKAADMPDWWKVNRLHAYCPEMSNKDIAQFLKIGTGKVHYYLHHAEISADAYADLPELPRF